MVDVDGSRLFGRGRARGGAISDRMGPKNPLRSRCSRPGPAAQPPRRSARRSGRIRAVFRSSTKLSFWDVVFLFFLRAGKVLSSLSGNFKRGP